MNDKYTAQLVLLPPEEFALRIGRVKEALCASNLDGMLVSDNANIYYLTGRVFCGYIYVPSGSGSPQFAVRRPCHLVGDGVARIRKVEDLPEMLPQGIRRIGLEMGILPYAAVGRIMKAFGDVSCIDATALLASIRSVKTDYEIGKLRESGVKHAVVYGRIPGIYRPGMNDVEFQIEIERAARLEGCLGQFRISGQDMELFMGNILVGDNADNPSPYDFAMGGGGIDPSLPVGANGSMIRRGESVMVDLNGNFNGYMTDMTRCFSLGLLPERAMQAHEASIAICDELARMGHPGAEAKSLYERALEMAVDAGFKDEFMGHRQHAGFVGHGVGIEINELPVLAPRSRSVLQAGNVIAIEPKFVIPGVGAVGIENTYVVRESGTMECLTNAPRQIIRLD